MAHTLYHRLIEYGLPKGYASPLASGKRPIPWRLAAQFWSDTGEAMGVMQGLSLKEKRILAAAHELLPPERRGG